MRLSEETQNQFNKLRSRVRVRLLGESEPFVNVVFQACLVVAHRHFEETMAEIARLKRES